MTNSLALIIEDDPDLATIFAEALRGAEFKTEIIRDGKAAINRLNTVIPSVVVLDLHLPFASGKEILKHIRADARLTDTRVILATADSSLADTLQAQVDLILLKPISFGQLRNLAARLRPPDVVGE